MLVRIGNGEDHLSGSALSVYAFLAEILEQLR